MTMSARVQDILKSLAPKVAYQNSDLALPLIRHFINQVWHVDAMNRASEEEREEMMTHGGDIVLADYESLFAYIQDAVAARLGERRCSICGAPLTVGYDEDGDVCAACFF